MFLTGCQLCFSLCLALSLPLSLLLARSPPCHSHPSLSTPPSPPLSLSDLLCLPLSSVPPLILSHIEIRADRKQVCCPSEQSRIMSSFQKDSACKSLQQIVLICFSYNSICMGFERIKTNLIPFFLYPNTAGPAPCVKQVVTESP